MDLDANRRQQCETLLRNSQSRDCVIVSSARVHGGCISDAFQLEFKSDAAAPKREAGSASKSGAVEIEKDFVFAKMATVPSDCFECEVSGLELLRSTGAIRIPHTKAWQSAPLGILLLEWIEVGTPQAGFWSDFGRSLAQMHLWNHNRMRAGDVTAISSFGFHDDNLVGATVQKNNRRDCWFDFFREQRLSFQVKLAEKNGLIDAEERRSLERIYSRLPELLAGDQLFPAVLHGDLWSGNFLCDGNGNPVLVDPAVFFGHHEYEFAMTKLFGGFEPAFYEAYHELLPADELTATRIEIYQLYHLLNHVNLFGRSYWPAIKTILKKYT